MLQCDILNINVGEQNILQELFTILKEVFGTSITISLLRLWRKEKELIVLLNKLTTVQSYFNVNRRYINERQRFPTRWDRQVVKGNLGYEILNPIYSNLFLYNQLCANTKTLSANSDLVKQSR